MSTAMPVLETERLIIRPFVPEDLEAVHRVLCDAWDVPEERRAAGLARRESWLRWAIANYEELVQLTQPPYGDRAIVLKASGELIGSVGLVPAFGPFGQIPGFPANSGSHRWFAEMGLFWAVDPAHQRKGYASEGASALIDFCFTRVNLGRIVATTEYENEASMGVMRKLGMEILRNPLREPEWFQVVGVLEAAAV